MADNKSKKQTAGGYAGLTGFRRAIPIILFAFSVFIALCFITQNTGTLGQAIAGFLTGLFSWAAYGIPLLLAIHAIFYPSDSGTHRVITRVIFTVITLVLIAALAHTFTVIGTEPVFTPRDFYEAGKSCVGGGFIGGVVAYGILRVIGTVGMIILAVAMAALYVAYCFSGKNSSLKRAGLSLLSLIVGFFALIEKGIKKLVRRSKEKNAEKTKRVENAKNENLYEDEFFAVDNGMQELEIPSLNIKESRDDESIEAHPTLHDTVYPKSEVGGENRPPRRVETDYGIGTDGTSDDESAHNGPADIIIESEAEAPPATDGDGRDEAASEVFGKDFDPYDIDLSAPPKQTTTRRADPGVSEYEKPLDEVTEESLARARRLEEFERRKAQLLGKQPTTGTASGEAATGAHTAGAQTHTSAQSAATEPQKSNDPTATATEKKNESPAGGGGELSREEQIARARNFRPDGAPQRAFPGRSQPNYTPDMQGSGSFSASPLDAETGCTNDDIKNILAGKVDDAEAPEDGETMEFGKTEPAASEPTVRAEEFNVDEFLGRYGTQTDASQSAAAARRDVPPATGTDGTTMSFGYEPARNTYAPPTTEGATTGYERRTLDYRPDNDTAGTPAEETQAQPTGGAATVSSARDGMSYIRTARFVSSMTAEPEKPEPEKTVIKDFKPASEILTELPERKQETADTEDKQEDAPALRIERSKVGDSLSAPAVSAPEEEDVPEMTEEDEPEEDEEDATGLDSYTEDVPEAEEIPPEKQNPDILDYRKRFTIFSDSAPENKQSDNGASGGLDFEPGDDFEISTDGDKDETDDDENADSNGTDDSDAEYIDEPEDEIEENGSDETDDETDKYDDEPDEEDAEDDLPPFDNAKDVSTPAKEVSAAPDYSNYAPPPLTLLKAPPEVDDSDATEEIQRNSEKLIDTLASFNVNASIKGVDRGPRITRYEVVPARGVKVSQVTSLFDDITMNLASEGIRMEAPIPGQSAIGFEIPNAHPATVFLRSLIESDEFSTAKSNTFSCIGKDVTGNPVFFDIAKAPHLLIAGATGMGKSVCINSILVSMLCKARPDELKLILVDPKKVEFQVYEKIPHLLVPVVTDVKQAAGALSWACEQMEKRYELMMSIAVRNIDAYNERVADDPSLGEPMTKIVIVIDELNDLMMAARDPVEGLITRLAQKARAAGIHLIIGTQRPSVNVITGVIKANIPSRLSCKVSSNVDSRTIIEQAGAEKLLDKGDALFWPVGKPKPLRVQCAFVSDKEVEAVMKYLCSQSTGNTYSEEILAEINSAAQKCMAPKKGKESYDEDGEDGAGSDGYYNDQKFIEAVEIAVRSKKISTSLLQRRLSIGYSKAAKYIDVMEDLGIVSEPNGQKPRDVLIDMDEWKERLSRYES